ncbi:MAG: TauD/TfdA family dioxygenase [Acidobacteriota bacterium]|nr:TauD/TfdA family dioxygenase [Acidobacteriota bacterium]
MITTSSKRSTTRRAGVRKRSSGVALQSLDLVERSQLEPGQPLPLVIRPKMEGVNLTQWFLDNRETLEQELLEYGAILFRGFEMSGDDDFRGFLDAVPYQLTPYFEGSTPREEVSSKVYTSTVYPKQETIALHNELTSSTKFPMKVWFYCTTPATSGGETPIADSRKVLDRIDEDVLQVFREKGWLLVRNYGDGLGLDWRDAFKLNNLDELNVYCRENEIDLTIKDGERFRTRQVRSSTLHHPVTGEEVWFNHIAFWHPANLNPAVRAQMERDFGSDGLPYHTFYGDGTPIPDEVARHLHQAYLSEKISFPWEKGDLLMLDNMLTSHGREPFEGLRQIRVAMAENYHRPPFIAPKPLSGETPREVVSVSPDSGSL